MAKAAKKARTPVDPNESKSAKFVRLGGPRVNRALKAIAGIAKLSGRGYEYTPAQVEKIGTALKDAVNSAMRKFDPNASKETDSGFAL